jgi:hypothetical protein
MKARQHQGPNGRVWFMSGTAIIVRLCNVGWRALPDDMLPHRLSIKRATNSRFEPGSHRIAADPPYARRQSPTFT